MVSLMEGKAAAPCARVAFNGNLVVDDGRLRREVGQDEAEAFVRHAGESLDAGRTVLLEGIGKLYKHQDGEVRFSAGPDNFSKETFGLPEINLKPIVRKEKPLQEPAPVASPTSQAPVLAGPISWQNKYGGALWYAAGLAGLLLILYLLFKLGGAIGQEFASGEEENLPRERVNEPAKAEREVTTFDANDIRPDAPPSLNDPTESASVAPQREWNTAIIAIGLFARQRNVDKQVRRLTEAGYTPYTDSEGRNTRLGIEVRYQDEGKLLQILRDVRARYTEDAFVMRVNGEERRPN